VIRFELTKNDFWKEVVLRRRFLENTFEYLPDRSDLNKSSEELLQKEWNRLKARAKAAPRKIETIDEYLSRGCKTTVLTKHGPSKKELLDGRMINSINEHPQFGGKSYNKLQTKVAAISQVTKDSANPKKNLNHYLNSYKTNDRLSNGQKHKLIKAFYDNDKLKPSEIITEGQIEVLREEVDVHDEHILSKYLKKGEQYFKAKLYDTDEDEEGNVYSNMSEGMQGELTKEFEKTFWPFKL